MSLRRLLCLPALALVAVPATPALADQAGELQREAPVAGYGGWEAWSTHDEASGRYTLRLPQLTVAYEGQPRRGQPLPFAGTLTEQVVAGNSVVSTTGLPGVSVELSHRTGANPERFQPTGLRAVTGADGSYRIVLPTAGADPWYTAVAPTADVPTWAGRGTVGSVAP